MLEAIGLKRRFGWRWALRGVDLNVGRGKPLALLGANGSGKTTLLRCFAGLLKPSDGELRLDGESLAKAVRGRVGLLTHHPLLYPSLTLRENLEFFGKIFALPRARIEARIADLAERLVLRARLDEPVQVLSQGLRQRAALARALLHEPDVVLLDEPFAGLDTEAVACLEETVRALAAGEGGRERILIFSTHDLARARSIAGDVALLAAGNLVLRAPAAEVTEQALAEGIRRGAREENAGKGAAA